MTAVLAWAAAVWLIAALFFPRSVGQTLARLTHAYHVERHKLANPPKPHKERD